MMLDLLFTLDVDLHMSSTEPLHLKLYPTATVKNLSQCFGSQAAKRQRNPRRFVWVSEFQVQGTLEHRACLLGTLQVQKGLGLSKTGSRVTSTHPCLQACLPSAL